MLEKYQLICKERLNFPGNMREIDEVITNILELIIRWKRSDDGVSEEYLDLITDAVEYWEKYSILLIRETLEIIELSMKFFKGWGDPTMR